MFDYDCNRSYLLERLVAGILIAALVFGGFVLYLYAVHNMTVKNVNDYYAKRSTPVVAESGLLEDEDDATVELQTSTGLE